MYRSMEQMCVNLKNRLDQNRITDQWNKIENSEKATYLQSDDFVNNSNNTQTENNNLFNKWYLVNLNSTCHGKKLDPCLTPLKKDQFKILVVEIMKQLEKK